MQKRVVFLLLLCTAILIGFPVPSEARDPESFPLSILQIMESILTPATDTLWQAVDPQTEAEWEELEDAAITVIAAGTLMNSGGSGPHDDTWAGKPAWRAFTQVMMQAAEDALEAARNRDIDSLIETGDALYSPCEACHQQYHPGVAGRNNN